MRRVVAIGMPVLSVLLLLVAGGLGAWAGMSFFDPFLWLPLSFACATVGALLWLRRAGGAIAGLLILNGVGIPAGSIVEAYARAGVLHDLPAAAWAAWLFQASLGFSISFFLILQLFPTGRPLTRRWRVLVGLTIANAALVFLVAALGVTPEFTANFPAVVHPLQVLPPDIARALDNVAGLGNILVFVAAAVTIVLRYRRSVGDERAQLKWFAAAAAITAAAFAVGIVMIPSGPAAIFASLAPLIPIAASVAILKYHLYDIDVVISKGVVFTALAAFITGVYVAIVVGIGGLTGNATNPALSIAATAVVAVLFQPARTRAQRFANRLVYGERATPYEVMAGFSARVADTLSTDEVLPRMAQAAGLGVGAVEASVAVVLPRGDERVERWSARGAAPARTEPFTIPFTYRGEPVGRLTVSKPHGEPLTPAERGLLEDLGSQAGLALHNVRLTEELSVRLKELDRQAAALRLSRERLVTARDAQRRGLQRDLHEGPERQLLDIAWSLDVVAAEDEPTPEELDGLVARANDTLDGLRDLARGIFPPLLAEKGVVPALEAHVRKVGANVTVETAAGFEALRFDPDTEACVYFCCLQAIQNVIRHAGNAACRVRLSAEGDRLAFEVVDEGPGFDVGRAPRRMGLQIVQDRVDALEGALRVVSAPGEGTTVAGTIPARPLEGARA